MTEARPAEVWGLCLRRVLGIAFAFLVLVAIVFELMDRPPTYSCAGDPPPEAAEARAGYVPGALAIAFAFGSVLAGLGWRWEAERSARLGGPDRPGTLALTIATTLLALWAALLASALIGAEASDAFFWGGLIALAGLALLALIGILLLAQLTLVAPTSRNWAARCEWMVVIATWVFALCVHPYTLVLIAGAGKDVTLWC